jgi:predicted enzyme related to lactoylglutathione lyase
MTDTNSSYGEATPSEGGGAVIGIGYVRIPAPELEPLAEFYKKALGLVEIGRIFEHAILFNVGATREEAAANKRVRIILDDRMTPNDQNLRVFMVKGVADVMLRAKENGATIVKEPSSVPGLNFIVATFLDPAGNVIELMEDGSDREISSWWRRRGRK